jgi:hypothetical protein
MLVGIPGAGKTWFSEHLVAGTEWSAAGAHGWDANGAGAGAGAGAGVGAGAPPVRWQRVCQDEMGRKAAVRAVKAWQPLHTTLNAARNRVDADADAGAAGAGAADAGAGDAGAGAGAAAAGAADAGAGTGIAGAGTGIAGAGARSASQGTGGQEGVCTVRPRLVIDRCSVELAERKKWLSMLPKRTKPQSILAVFMDGCVDECLGRVRLRGEHPVLEAGCVGAKGIVRGFARRLVPPTTAEGFGQVVRVTTPEAAANLLATLREACG